MLKSLDSLNITVIAEDTVPYESPLWGQHGISFLVEGISGESSQCVMVDVAQNFTALEHNMTVLGLDFSMLDTLMITHCHYDHSKGISLVLEATGKEDVPVVAHSDLFRLHFVTDPFLMHVGIMGSDSRQRIEDAGGTLFLTSEPLDLMPGLRSTGEVPRITAFEDPGIALKTIDDGKIRNDLVMDDISLVANVRDKGLVIITGCSHAGIVNIARYAMELFPGVPLEGIIGGLHLVEASDEKIGKTVKALVDLNPKWISAGHCTGFRAQVKLLEAFGDRFEPLSSGKTFRI
ncbi:MAG: MBL fold metallo-hydrolase [Synergistales bacterium]|nr:MBL fold metallo-hydrolase [Synergistales bacterium]